MSAPANTDHEPVDPIEAATHKIPWAIPLFGAVMAGLMSGIGILILIRHGASLGGIGVLAIYLQKRKGWRAGSVQMGFDCLILSLGLLVVSPEQVALSIIGAAALNLVIAVNHRPDRYHGF